DLRNLHLVTRSLVEDADWVAAINEAAARPIASLYDFSSEPFPFAPGFYLGEGFIVGKLPDGTQLLLSGGPGFGETVEGVSFDPAGTQRPGTFPLPVPPEVANPWSDGRELPLAQAEEAYNAWLRREYGFEPTLIRVRDVDWDPLGSPDRFPDDISSAWGQE